MRRRVPEEKIPDSTDTVRFSSFFSLFCKLLPKTEGHPKKSTWKATQQEILHVSEACPTTNPQLETPKKNIQIHKYVLQRGLIIDVSETTVVLIRRLLKQTHRVQFSHSEAKMWSWWNWSNCFTRKVLQKEKAPREEEVWAGWVGVQTLVAHPGSQRSRPSETKHQWSSAKPHRTNCSFTSTACERNHEVWHCSSVIWQRVGCLCFTDEGRIQASRLKPLDIKDTWGLVQATVAVTETGYF